jgi:hypothetical protein
MNQFTCKGVKQINNRISLNMTFTFTIRICRRFSSAREFQMRNFQKYWSQNVGQDFLVLDFFHGRKILKVDGKDPQNREKNSPAGRFTCMIIWISFNYMYLSPYALTWIHQSSNLGGNPKLDACKIVHMRIKWVVPQARRACEKKSHIV